MKIKECDDPGFDYSKIKYVAAFDISLSKEEDFKELAIASMCVMEFPSLKVVYE